MLPRRLLGFTGSPHPLPPMPPRPLPQKAKCSSGAAGRGVPRAWVKYLLLSSSPRRAAVHGEGAEAARGPVVVLDGNSSQSLWVWWLSTQAEWKGHLGGS